MLAESPARPSTPEAPAASLPRRLLRLPEGGANQFPGGNFTHCSRAPFTAHLCRKPGQATPAPKAEEDQRWNLKPQQPASLLCPYPLHGFSFDRAPSVTITESAQIRW